MDYKIYKSQLVIDNHDEMVKSIHKAYVIHQNLLQGKDSTWSYSLYNFFALTSPNPLFRELFLN